MKHLKLYFAVFVGSLLITGIALATSDVSGAKYRGTVTVLNSGGATGNVSANVSISTPGWITGGYLNPTAADAAWHDPSGSDVPFMPGYDVNPWIFWLSTIGAGEGQTHNIYSSNVTGGSYAIFLDTAGMTTSSALSLGSGTWGIEQSRYVDASQVGVDLIKRPNTGPSPYFRLYINAANSITVLVMTNSGVTTSFAHAITTGEHVIDVFDDGANIALEIDGTASGSMAHAVPGDTSATDWVSAGSGYIYSQKIWVGGVLTQRVKWNYGATLTDLAPGGAYPATPTFRTTGSSANVTASLSSFSPVSEAKAPGSVLSTAPGFITGTPTVSGNFTTNMTATYPGSDIIAALSAATNTPSQLVTLILAAFLFLALSWGISYLFKRAGGQSLFIKFMIMFAAGCVGVGLGVFDFWMIGIFYLILGSTTCFLGAERRTI